jgi:hypothetical protein
MLAFFAAYLLFIVYFMLGSRYPYAWGVSGWVAILAWSGSYGNEAGAFDYAVFRYLETTAGVVIFTIVCMVLWPRRAGDQLGALGGQLWTAISDLFSRCRDQLEGGDVPEDVPEVRGRLSVTMMQMKATLDAAYADTPWVARTTPVWERFRGHVRSFHVLLETWRQTIEDAATAEPIRRVPGLDGALDRFAKRVDRIAALWASLPPKGDPPPDEDGDLLEAIPLTEDADACLDLSHLDRAAIAVFVTRWIELDASCVALLHDLRELALGIESPAHPVERDPIAFERPPRFVPGRLVKAAYPSACMIVAFLLWIVADPPTGPTVPAVTAPIAIVLALTGMSAVKLLNVFLISIWVTVAPFYFFVMPALDSGEALFAATFVFAFLFGILGPVAPLWKTMPLMMFTTMTGISNDQSYSFMAFAMGAQMLFLVFLVAAVLGRLWFPSRPEMKFLGGVRKLLAESEQVLAGLSRGVVRRHCFQAMGLVLARQLPMASKGIEYDRFPENDPKKVQALLGALDVLVTRLKTLAVASAKGAGGDPIADELRALLRRRLRRWGTFETDGDLAKDPDIEVLIDKLRRRADAAEEIDREAYAVFGAARGFVSAMRSTQGAMKAIRWDQWEEARF